jgi:molybdopterin-binding protein
MSKLLAKITQIQNVDNLNIVNFDFYGTKLSMMSLELNNNVVVGAKVILNIKSTSITIAKDFTGELSVSNRLKANIEAIEVGQLLCNIKLSIANTIFETIITKDTLKRLDLKISECVDIFIKASELSISEVIDG